ncbi:perlucin-like protein [Ruditapes philippinarum]|uniref:perlucin-like protein n=1 Tax=Ruditapes philippinarum TaxID=129788 RepID=UPI00295C1566|nr:perlucin-like protein [Ruditapes philippinarum]
MKMILRIFVALFCCTVSVRGCPDGWVSHRSTCYHFSHDKETWANALTICQIFDGNLVEVKDTTEHMYLLSQAKLYDTSYWIGLNNIQKQSTWVWIDSNGQNNYTHWASGKPDNAQNDANCALLDEHHGFSWNNVHCSDLIHYICKKSEEVSEIIG